MKLNEVCNSVERVLRYIDGTIAFGEKKRFISRSYGTRMTHSNFVTQIVVRLVADLRLYDCI
jgi:hypothetical protein